MSKDQTAGQDIVTDQATATATETPTPPAEPKQADELLDEVLGETTPTPEAPTPETPEADRAQAGMLRDLQSERARRQEAESRLARMEAMEAELAQLREKVSQAGETAGEEDPLAGLDDEDFVSAATVRAAMTHAQRQAAQAQQAQQIQQARQRERFNRDADAIGTAFYSDYADVLGRGGALLTPEEVAHVQTASTPADAAKRAYGLCRQRLGQNATPAAAPSPSYTPLPPGAAPAATPAAPQGAALAQLVDVLQSTTDEGELNRMLARLQRSG